MAKTSTDPFFIGYASKAPAPIRRLMGLVSVLLLLLVSGLALGLYLAQGAQPTTRFIGGQTVTGLFQATPYPLLQVPPSPDYPQGRTVVLTGNPKFGVDPAIASELAGRWVSARGAFFRRDQQDILVIFNQRQRLTAIDPPPEAAGYQPAAARSLGRHTLRGEIVDPKCFLGAMRPGQERVHKGCAILCLRGGIPPFFVKYNDDGGFDALLMTNEQRQALTEAQLETLLAFVGDPVALSGEVERQGDLWLFRVDPQSLQRL